MDSHLVWELYNRCWLDRCSFEADLEGKY
jgi:hypothetical protein